MLPFAPLAGFDSKKAAQISAYFLSLQPDMEKLKLIKLLYLSERAHLGKHGHPMFYDEMYSLKDGPICSSALNGINGEIDAETWKAFVVVDENRRNLHLNAKITRDALDQVSDAEIDVLDEIWSQFKASTAGQIRNWTHANCPEYTHVENGRVPISYAEMMDALGIDDKELIEDEISHVRRTASYLSL